MNQLFYNVAGEILHPKSDTNNGQHYLRSVCSVKRIVTALMPSLVSRCFSLFLPRLRILAKGKRSQNCLRFGIGGLRLYFYPLLSRNKIFLSVFTNSPLAQKKNFWRSYLRAPTACAIEIWSTLTDTEFDCSALLYVRNSIYNIACRFV